MRNLIQIAGSPACSLTGGSTYNTNMASSNFTACSINVSISDMRLYIARAHSLSIPKSIPLTYHLKQFSNSLSPLSNGTTNNITVNFKDGRELHILLLLLLT